MEKKLFKSALLLFMSLLLTFQSYALTDILSGKVSVSYSGQSVETVLQDLKNRYKLNIAYSNDARVMNRKVNFKLKNSSLKQVLNELARQAELEYEVLNGQIVIREKRKVKAEIQTGPILYQTVKGKVLDKDSKMPLIGVNLVIRSMSPFKGTSTNLQGEFKFQNVPVGRHIIEVTYIGYKSAIFPEVLVGSGKEVNLNIELSEIPSSLEAVVITDKKERGRPLNQMASVSARSFSVEETSRYAASMFDPARMAQSFAGVASGNDLTNDIVVRGNSPKGLQWRLEGTEIINPNHFGDEGSSGGGISMISSSMLSNSDFFTGAFPAEYGNALSGVFDLQFRKGNTEKREYSFMAGILGTEASLEGPFKKGSNSSYLVNYRYSTLGVLEKIGVSPLEGGRVPIYQDLAYNLNFPTKKAGTFSLFGIGGMGSAITKAKRDVNEWKGQLDKFDLTYANNSGSTGLKHVWLLNDKVFLKNIVSWSGSRTSFQSDTLTNDYQPNLYDKGTYDNTALRFTGLVNYKSDSRNTFRGGLIVSDLGFNMKAIAYRRDIGRIAQVLDNRGNAWNYEAYSQWKHQFNEALSINTGLHANYFNLSKSFSVEPRIGLNWWLSPNQQLSLGAGIHSRLEPMAFYMAATEQSDGTFIASNKRLSPTKALHFVAGYDRSLSSNLKLKAEAYYQYLYHVPVSSDPGISYSTLNSSDVYYIYSRDYRTLVNKGTGLNAGIEFTLEKSLDKGYYFMLTSSLYDSKFKTISKKEYNTVFNGGYIGRFVTGKEWKTGANNKNLFGLNTKMIYNGGRPYSPINLQESIHLNEEVIEQDKVNTLRMLPYFRLDLSVSYRINRPKLSHAFYLDLQNIMNRRNEWDRFYNSDKKIIETSKQAGMIPSIYYRIEF